MFPLASEQTAQEKGSIHSNAVFVGSIAADGLHKLKEISAKKSDTSTAFTCLRGSSPNKANKTHFKRSIKYWWYRVSNGGIPRQGGEIGL